ncbi:hypothetical protein MHK_008290 [Candidatus Magnetomorum sp. HK-1]|nr:hypothetical protein MHK_008290 [Candidatus Magnetomorum sp. HK-1]
MPEALWRWKYIDNPYEVKILLCVTQYGKPVVLYGGIPFKANICGREMIMIHLSDIMSHPEYRKTGLFIHTVNAYFEFFGGEEEVGLMYGFPGKYHFDPEKQYELWRYRSRFHKDWQAFMVLLIQDNKAVIIDMLVADSEKLFYDFLGNIASMLIEKNIEIIETWIPGNHFLVDFFFKCGFIKLKEPIGIIPTIRLFDNTIDLKWTYTHFYYTMGDGDLF